MRTITKDIYNFSELSEEAKKKVLEDNRDWHVDSPYWYTCVTEAWKDKLLELGYTDVDIQFNGFYSQGDGACFTGLIDILKWIEAHELQKEFDLLYSSDKYGTYDWYGAITHEGRYYYSKSTDVNVWADIPHIDPLPF